MMKFALTASMALTAGVLNSTAFAAATITQQNAAAPTYGTLLTFDEPGTPTGLVASNYWSASHDITLTDGVNPNATIINDFSGSFPWIDSGNATEGSFGVHLTFSTPVTSLSFQCWDPSGPPNFFGNGLAIFVFDENDVQIGFMHTTGAWGGIGNSWFDITTTDGSTIGRVVMTNNSFNPVTYVDNISWTAVPAPGSLALLALAGLCGRKRRR